MATKRFRRPFRRSPSTCLLAVLAISMLALTQCRMAQDNVTGVNLGSHVAMHGNRGLERCIRQCNDRYSDCRRAEDRKHSEALRQCEHKSDGRRRHECRRDEAHRHDAAKDRCRLEMQDCKRDCRYREGGGNGGR